MLMRVLSFVLAFVCFFAIFFLSIILVEDTHYCSHLVAGPSGTYNVRSCK